MKRHSLVFYFAVLVASLALAYLTWVAEPKKPLDGAPALRCKKGDILKLTYAAKDRTVTFWKKKSRYSEEPSWWVEVVPLQPSAAAKAVDVAEEAGQGEVTAGSSAQSPEDDGSEGPDLQEGVPSERASEIEVFKANKGLRARMDEFCPWNSLRSLGNPAGEKREEFGLTQSAESLTIELASGPRTFRVGDSTFGPKDRYLADEETGEVFLVAGQDLRDLLQPKTRFMERSLHAFTAKEVARVRLRADHKEKELLQQFSEEGKEQGWADSRAPEEAKELYKNWIRKLFALRPTDYVRLPEGEEAGGCIAPAGSAQELNLTFYGPDREIGFLAVYKGTDNKGDATYYACTEYTEIVVKVPKTQAETLLKDMEDLLSD